jgi:hypothetical protein
MSLAFMISGLSVLCIVALTLKNALQCSAVERSAVQDMILKWPWQQVMRRFSAV